MWVSSSQRKARSVLTRSLAIFSVGMHLIDERLNGVPVPEDVPSDVASILEA